MPPTSSEPPTSGFQYYLHVWRDDPETGARRLADLLGTDGARVCSMRSRGSFLTFEEVEALDVARTIVDTIEGEWEPEAPFFGYESLSDSEMVAILHNARQVEQQWAVFPCTHRECSTGELTEAAVTANEGSRHHLIAGNEVVWESGEPFLRGAIEARSWQQQDVEEAAGLLEHVESWQLRATAERRDEIREVGLVAEEDREVVPEAPVDGRLEAEFPLDRVIMQNYADQPTFQPWFVLQFDSGLFSVPDIWRRFWMSIELDD